MKIYVTKFKNIHVTSNILCIVGHSMYNQQPKCINLPILYLKFISSLYLSFKVGKIKLNENINSNFHDTSINNDNLLIKESYASSYFLTSKNIVLYIVKYVLTHICI